MAQRDSGLTRIKVTKSFRGWKFDMYSAGEEYDYPSAEAWDRIKSGQAEFVSHINIGKPEPSGETQTRMDPAPKNRIKAPPKNRTRRSRRKQKA